MFSDFIPMLLIQKREVVTPPLKMSWMTIVLTTVKKRDPNQHK